MRNSRTSSWRAYRPEGGQVARAGDASGCRILGLDPGSRRTGYGILAWQAGQYVHVAHGCIDVSGLDFVARLRRIFEAVQALVATHAPDEVAVERVFVSRNPDSALKLGQARGAAMCAAVLRDLPVHEYAAKEIKLAVVGKGGAEKVQIQHMVGVMLNLHGKIQSDAADALAVAITHAHVRATAQRIGVSARQVWSRK